MTINGWNPEQLRQRAFNYDIPFHQMVNVADNEWERCAIVLVVQASVYV